MNNSNNLTARKMVINELKDAFNGIVHNHKYLNKQVKRGEQIVASGEWLLDNIYLIEKEYKSIKFNLPIDYFNNLPSYNKQGNNEEIPRIYGIAKKYIDELNYVIKEEDIFKYLSEDTELFTMGEIWAFPLMLRIALIIKIANITNSMVIMQKQRSGAEKLAGVVVNAYNKGKIDSVLEKLEKQYMVNIDNEINENENQMDVDVYDKFMGDSITLHDGLFSTEFVERYCRILKDNSIEDERLFKFVLERLESKSNIKQSIIKENVNESIIESGIGATISSLRIIDGIDWKEFFEKTSEAEKLLNSDPTGTYSAMDFKTKDYYRHKVEMIARQIKISETKLIYKVLELCNEAINEGREVYKGHVGYYLVDEGVNELAKSLNYKKNIQYKLSAFKYIMILITITFIIDALVLSLSNTLSLDFSIYQDILAFLIMLIPASEITNTLVNWNVTKILTPSHIPKLSYEDGIPASSKTVVIIPAIVSSSKAVVEFINKLEVYYLANRDNNVYFALLGDFQDSSYEKTDLDNEINKAGIETVKELNKKYFEIGQEHFFFLNRKREFNDKENVYMGYERKRGKIMEFISLLKGDAITTYNIISTPINHLKDAKYIITLDSDTILPIEVANKLIGAMDHPLNNPYIMNGVVKRGYGIMQPKVSVTLEGKNRTYFSKLFAGDAGIDCYSTASSDTYQDIFGEGIFTGKGIINIDVFYEVLKNDIKDNTVLSHDLLEGSYARCALVTDLEFIDGYPAYYASSALRLHRWVRGDWQLIGWAFSKKISLLSKWKIIDNLRRSLLAPSIVIGLIMTLTMLGGERKIGVLLFLAIIIPLVFTITDFVVTPKNKLMGTMKTFKHIVLIISFLPFQGYLMLDAMIRTIYRVIISKKHLLQWQTADYIERTISNTIISYYKLMWISPVIGVVLAIISFRNSFIIGVANTSLVFLWILGPFLAYRISKTIVNVTERITEEQEEFLRELSRGIWAYYEDFVNEEHNYLPPDNYQEKPYKGVAARTSPTNIGMGVMANLIAYDLGYIAQGELIRRTENTIQSMNNLEKYKGHFLNWYNTKTTEALWPRYVSTVDSGNLASNLWIVSSELKKFKNKSIIREIELKSLRNSYKLILQEDKIKLQDNLSEEIDLREYKRILNNELEEINKAILNYKDDNKEQHYWLRKVKYELEVKLDFYNYIFSDIEELFLGAEIVKESLNLVFIVEVLKSISKSNKEKSKLLNKKIVKLEEYLERIDNLTNEIDKILKDMDFRSLFNKKLGLFSIGYNLEEDSLGNSYYDLLASESRATSFIAIARGEVNSSHWYKLGRNMTKVYGNKSLVSWSGTMFEYFMPYQIMKNFRHTLLDSTYEAVVQSQIAYGNKRKTPWGISESAYYQFDIEKNYQYKAFGVPGIGMKRGLEEEIVISPYSSIMTIPYERNLSIENLKKIKELGAYGKYGYIEAIDYSKGKGEEQEVRCYMVHHLGMSLMALDNAINNNILQKRFHSIPEIKATEILLKEKVPSNITFDRVVDLSRYENQIEKEYFIPRIFTNPKVESQDVLMLSNGSYSTMLTTAGSGYSKKDKTMVYRWKKDSTTDSTGMFFYIKNLDTSNYWSASYEPCKEVNESYNVEFTLNKAAFKRIQDDIECCYEIFISPEDDVEIRSITLKNLSEKRVDLEITSYLEVTLATFEGDIAHPSFSNLFITTEFNEDACALVANRRARSKNEKTECLAQSLLFPEEIFAGVTYETSRLNFIGRCNTLKTPEVMKESTPLRNTVGIVLDPVMSLRGKISLEHNEEKKVCFITTVASCKEAVLENIKKYRKKKYIEKVLDESHYSNSLELKYIGIKSAQANLYQSLATNILFLNNKRKNRESFIKNIKNTQEDLWAFGISGDLPIVLIVISEEEDITSVRQIINMHYYWRNKGLITDLIIYNCEEASYNEPLQKSIFETLRSSPNKDNLNKAGGVFIYNRVSMNEEIKNFIIGIANLFIDCKDGSLVKQINKEMGKLSESSPEYENEFRRIPQDINEMKKNKEEKYDFSTNNFRENRNNEYRDKDFHVEKLDFYNGYGGFNKENLSYIIRLKDFKNTPSPWINVISNEDFGFHISEVGSAYTWCDNSRENKITPWSNDWVIDPLGEALYIRDDESGECFSISPKPLRDGGEYIIEHGFGYSSFKHTANEISGVMKVFCPKGERLKLYKITLKNNSSTNKKLSLFYYSQLVLGVHNYSTSKNISTCIKRQQYIWGQNPYSKYFGENKVYLTVSNGEEIYFTGDRKEFIGSGESIEEPKALKNYNLLNNCGSIYDPCLAVQNKLELNAYEEKELIIILGAEKDESLIEEKINKYNNIINVDKSFQEVKEYWRGILGKIQVETPDKSMDYLLNGWLIYQNLSCRYLARTAFYQSGGAYGFRDQLQDSLSIGILNPQIPREQILRNAARQYVEGDVQHWWHPVVNAGIRTRFSDDLLWLPYAVVEYIKMSGDYSILNEKVKYLEDEPLKKGEDERYTIVNKSGSEGTIYEHCLKAINKGLNFGKHNIPLMGSGDWNDGMSTVGNEGKGESVWLGWFLYSILDGFMEISNYKKDISAYGKFKNAQDFIKENIEKNAWDGSWYRRAYFDDGTPLGSIENEECKIDSLAQSWSVISGAADINKAKKAMASVDKYLVNKDKGMILLLAPPFNNSSLEPGYIKGYVPGVRENGGQYTHAAVWVIMALTKLGENNKALEYYNMINPINHTSTELHARNYKLEPYVMAADVYIREPHSGRGGWSWYTGTAGWMYKVGLENILGFKQVNGKGYKIEPCVPEDWKEYTVTIKEDKIDYIIKIVKSKKKGIVMDSKEIEGDIIPKIEGKHSVIVYF